VWHPALGLARQEGLKAYRGESLGKIFTGGNKGAQKNENTKDETKFGVFLTNFKLEGIGQ